MTVQAATRMWSRHDAGFDTERGRSFKASIREAYQVVCDADDTLQEITYAPGLPLLNDRYPGTSQIRVKSMTPRQVSPIFWIVEIQYEGPYGPLGAADSPLNERPTIRWGKTESDEPVDEDLAGKPIATINGEPIEGVTKKISDLTLQITRNYAVIDLAATHEYLHSVNSDMFAGFAAGVCRMVEFSAEEVYAAEIGGYWKVSAGFHFRFPYRTTPQKAWYARVMNQGYRVKVDYPTGVKIENAKDASMQEVTKPVLLKVTGYPETLANTANWLEFQIYKPLPYNALGLL